MSIWLNGPIRTQFRIIDGLTIRFAESEARDDHALLFSPWPESLFAYEPVWFRLAEHTHLVAVDLPGFGHSQRRDDLLSPHAMGGFLPLIAERWRPGSSHSGRTAPTGPTAGTSWASSSSSTSTRCSAVRREPCSPSPRKS